MMRAIALPKKGGDRFDRQEGAIVSQITGTMRAIAGVSKKRRSLLLKERGRSLE